MRHLRTILLLVASLGAGVAVPVASSPAERGAAVSSESAQPPATLRFFNRHIITFRSAFLGYQPAERVSMGKERIRQALGKGGPGAVTVTRIPEGLAVAVDGNHAFRVLEGDLDAEDGQTFDQARIVVSQRLRDALAAARQAGTPHVLARGFLLGGAATLILALSVWVIHLGRMWIRRRINVSLGRRLHLGFEERAGLLRLVRAFGQIAFVAVVAILVEEWLRFVLAQFPYTRPWAEHLNGWVAGIVAQVSDSIVDAVPGLVMVAVIAALAHLAAKIVRTVSRAVETGRHRLFGIDAEIAQPTRRIVTVALWLFALAMAYPYLPGASSDAFKGLSVLVGVMLSLGASGIVGQAASSFIITFSRALRRGEWVRIGEVEGAVVGVGVFATKIRTFNDEEISIPNNVVLTSITKNFSRPAASTGSILETSVSIGYSAPWRQVHAMLREAAARTPELEREPPPDVLQNALSDFYVQYTLRARLRNQLRRPAVLSALNANVQDVFNEYGVQIMSPHYLGDPAAPVVIPKKRWFEPPAERSEEVR